MRGGLIGCGFFAQFHIEAWRRIPGVSLVAACDPDVDRARDAASRAYSSAEEMFRNEELDFVDIATRPDSHLELVRLAAAHRVPAICQKPMAPALADSVAMVEAAEAAGIPLMIHENWRWQPWYRVIKSRIEEGAIGSPITYCFRIRKNDGGGDEPYRAQPYFRTMPRLLMFETMIHPVDTARFLFGDIARVYATARRHNRQIAGEDVCAITLSHQSGIDGIVDGHRFLDLTDDSPPLGDSFFEGDAGWLQVVANGDVFGDGVRIWHNTVREGYRGDSVRATQAHFIDCLRSGTPFETGARAYLHSYAAVEAAYLAAAGGRSVAVSQVLSAAPQDSRSSSLS
jgi:predicted dehydrogenase